MLRFRLLITILLLVAFEWPATVTASPSPPSSSTECVRKWIDGQSIKPFITNFLNDFWRCTNIDPGYAVDSNFSQHHKPWVAIDSNHPDFMHNNSDALYDFANEQCLDLTNDPEAVARYPMDRHAKVVFDIAGRIMDFSAEWREYCEPYISLLSHTNNPAYSKCTPSASACAIPVDMNECLSYTGRNCAHIMDSVETRNLLLARRAQENRISSFCLFDTFFVCLSDIEVQCACAGADENCERGGVPFGAPSPPGTPVHWHVTHSTFGGMRVLQSREPFTGERVFTLEIIRTATAAGHHRRVLMMGNEGGDGSEEDESNRNIGQHLQHLLRLAAPQLTGYHQNQPHNRRLLATTIDEIEDSLTCALLIGGDPSELHSSPIAIIDIHPRTNHGTELWFTNVHPDGTVEDMPTGIEENPNRKLKIQFNARRDTLTIEYNKRQQFVTHFDFDVFENELHQFQACNGFRRNP